MDAAAGDAISVERFPTLNHMFLDVAQKHADRPLLGTAAAPERISFAEFERRVRQWATVLRSWGIAPGDRVALLSENRPEWPTVDAAVLSLGAVTVPIYPTLPPGQVLEIVEDAEPRALIVADQARATAVAEAANGRSAPWRLATLDELAAAGRDAGDPTPAEDAAWRARALQVGPEDLATLIYTSGTTGRPKGVMLTHANLAGMVAATVQYGAVSAGPGDVVLSVLPLAHVLERVSWYYFFSSGTTTVYATSMQTVAADLAAVRPHHLVAVPRLFEKVYAAVTGARGLKGVIARWTAKVAYAVARRVTRGRSVSLRLRLWRAVSDRLVYRVLRQRLGGRINTVICGGAPLDRHICGFFFTAGIPLFEGYGLTETSPVISANRPGTLRLGSAGKAYPGVEVRIGPENEIQTRGPHVTRGYWRQPEATAEAFTEDGWFRTGDVGSIDRDGFIFVVDRLKDLIVTAGGKNIAPGPLEQRVTLAPHFTQAVLLGDRRPYPVMLVVPEYEAVAPPAAEGQPRPTLPELAADPHVQQRLAHEVAHLLRDAARVERPKRIAVLGEEFTLADGLLTPTLKVRRRAVASRYQDLLDRMYSQEAGIAVPWPDEGRS